MRINLKLFNLAIDKIKEQINYHVDLLDDRLVYQLETIVDRIPDLESEEEEYFEHEEDVYVFEKLTVKRSALTGTMVSFSSAGEDGGDLFIVYINSMSDNDQIKVSFSSRKQALDFEKQIQEYIFETK